MAPERPAILPGLAGHHRRRPGAADLPGQCRNPLRTAKATRTRDRCVDRLRPSHDGLKRPFTLCKEVSRGGLRLAFFVPCAFRSQGQPSSPVERIQANLALPFGTNPFPTGWLLSAGLCLAAADLQLAELSRRHKKARPPGWTIEQLKNGSSQIRTCLLYTSPSPRDLSTSRMPSSA